MKGDKLDNDNRFTSLIQDGSDVHIWANVARLYGNSLDGGVTFYDEIKYVARRKCLRRSSNFDNGKITVKTETVLW